MTDVITPEMNGRDLAGKITSLYPDIKPLFMSGYTADIIAHQGVLDEGVGIYPEAFFNIHRSLACFRPRTWNSSLISSFFRKVNPFIQRCLNHIVKLIETGDRIMV